jgi:hypothetical protein
MIDFRLYLFLGEIRAVRFNVISSLGIFLFFTVDALGSGRENWWKPFCPVREGSLSRSLGPGLKQEEAGLRARLFDLEDRFGPCNSWEKKADGWIGRYGQAEVALSPILSSGKLNKIGFGPVKFPGDSLEKLIEFTKTHGLVAFSSGEDGKKVFGRGEATEVSIGELIAFPVLAALREAKLSDKIVRLRPDWQYFSPGPTFYWPESSPLTLETLALLMIQQGDLVAMDHLWNALGREVVTKSHQWFGFELVALLSGNEKERSMAQQSKVLPEAVKIMRRPDPLPSASGALDRLGWMLSPEALCRAALKVRNERMLWFQGEAPDGFEYWWESQGRFPLAQSILRLFKEKGKPWQCVFVSIEKGKPRAMEQAYTLLERLTLFKE